MTKTAANGSTRDEYLELVQRFPLKSIQDDSHLKDALCILDNLAQRNHLSSGEEDYLDALTDLVEKYEDSLDGFNDSCFVDVLKELMRAHGMTQKALVEATGISKSLVSELLSKKREPTLEVMRKLGECFSVPPSVFMF